MLSAVHLSLPLLFANGGDKDYGGGGVEGKALDHGKYEV